MARVFLVQPPWYVLQGITSKTTSLGLAYIASVLRDCGHQVLIFNGEPFQDKTSAGEEITMDTDNYKHAHELTNPIWNRFGNALKLFRPDLVGISMWTGAYQAALNIASLCKEFNPSLPVIVGGIHPTLLPVDILGKNAEVDYVVAGEGEKTVVELVSALEKGLDLDKIPGIYFRKEGSIIGTQPRPYLENLDELPFPDFAVVFEREFYNPDAFGAMVSSRGCPYSCTYCASHLLWGKEARFRSPQNFVDEIEHRINTVGTRNFRFNDDTFTLKKERVFAICELILSRSLNIKWQCDVRADLLSEDMLKDMKRAGCYQISMGVESGNPEILSKINKNITLEQIRNSAGMIRSAGIAITMYFMLGFPGETKEQVMDSMRLMHELKPDVPIWSLVTPYPGTAIYEYAKQQGLLPATEDWSLYFHHSDKMKLTRNITDSQWQELIKEIKQDSFRMRNISRLRKKRYAYFKRFGYGNLLRVFRQRFLLPFQGALKKIESFSFVILNKSRKRQAIPKVYYGRPINTSSFAAVLKVKKLEKYFPEYKMGFNLIYTNNGSFPDYAVCRYAKRLGIPIIYNANGLHYKAWYGPGWEKRNEVMRRTYDLADYIFFQSDFSKLSAETFLGKPRCKWEVLYNAVDTSYFTPSKEETAENLVILCAGNHTVFYPLEVTVEAFRIVRREYSDARLIIAGRLGSGDGHFQVEGRIQELVSKMGLEEATEFLGVYSQEQAPDIFRKAHIFVTCRYAEPCPTAIIEAMACGLPVVYSQSGGAPELVGFDAGIGLAVKLDWDYYQVPEPQDVAGAILKIAKNRQTMAIAARERAARCFDIKHWIERHREVFNLFI